MKRLFDVIFSLIGLVLSAPIILIAGIAVKLSSAGPAIFAQERVGRRKKIFTCYKLRTMNQGTAQVGTHDVDASSVVEGVGSFLRSSKLDELPQFWNVLIGDMSFVGPRPCLPVQVELIAEREKRGVLEVLPGITGLSQVEGIDMSEPVRLAERDADYVRDRSFLLDMKSLFWTIGGKGRGDRVRS